MSKLMDLFSMSNFQFLLTLQLYDIYNEREKVRRMKENQCTVKSENVCSRNMNCRIIFFKIKIKRGFPNKFSKLSGEQNQTWKKAEIFLLWKILHLYFQKKTYFLWKCLMAHLIFGIFIVYK